MAWKIAKGLYLVPLLIAYTNLVSWDVTSVLVTGGFAIIGTYAFVAAIEGYLENKINLLTRAVLIALGVALVWPDISVVIRLVCVALFIGLFIHTARQYDANQVKKESEDEQESLPQTEPDTVASSL